MSPLFHSAMTSSSPCILLVSAEHCFQTQSHDTVPVSKYQNTDSVTRCLLLLTNFDI